MTDGEEVTGEEEDGKSRAGRKAVERRVGTLSSTHCVQDLRYSAGFKGINTRKSSSLCIH